MKKVLIITYYWPPSGGAGVQRWLKFAKYLSDFGWEPIIYTVENGEYPVLDYDLSDEVPNGITVLKTPIWEPYSIYKKFTGRKKEDKINSGFLSEKKNPKLLDKLSIWIRGNLFIPDARKFWIKPSVNFLTKYLKDNPVDVVVSSGPPHSSHLIALKLKENNKLPWVADFRDPWTNIDYYKDLLLSKKSDLKHQKLENNVLTKADKVITIGKSLSEELNALGANNIDVIENGFDSDDFQLSEDVFLDNEFSIAHIGSFTPSRNHIVFWQALKELITENINFSNDLKLQLVGKVDYSVIMNIEKYGLEKYVNYVGYVPHREVIKYQKKSKLLLLMINNTPNAKGIITGKVFEYIASKRPILVIGPEDGDLSTIVNTTKSGIVCGFDDVKKLKLTLLRLYNNEINFEPNPAAYSRQSLTKKLSEILNQLT
tara:strand:- start:5034 stop:6317 length:1284 start_codon:yes stop_codon:yes gene_type:complete